MAKGTTFDNDLMKLIFNGTAISLLADPTATSNLSVLWVSLHTADPTAGNTQSSSEISYSPYARVSVNRTTGAGGFTVTANAAYPASNVPFAAYTSGTGGVVTNFAIGTASSGAGKILYTGTVSPNITVGSGSTPILTGTGTSSGTAITES